MHVLSYVFVHGIEWLPVALGVFAALLGWFGACGGMLRSFALAVLGIALGFLGLMFQLAVYDTLPSTHRSYHTVMVLMYLAMLVTCVACLAALLMIRSESPYYGPLCISSSMQSFTMFVYAMLLYKFKYTTGMLPLWMHGLGLLLTAVPLVVLWYRFMIYDTLQRDRMYAKRAMRN